VIQGLNSSDCPRIRRMKINTLSSIPNMLSTMRLLLIPVIWAAALLDRPFYVGAGLAAAGVTDVLDGYFARRLGLVSAYGSRLDSIADTLVVVSVVGWVLLLRPEIFPRHRLLVSLWVVAEAASILVGWIKFRRIANLHLYLTKAAGAVGYAFIVYAFIIGYSDTFFYVAMALLIAASLECFLIQLLSGSVDEQMKSIFHAYRTGRIF
jgi:cardiolipin synthase